MTWRGDRRKFLVDAAKLVMAGLMLPGCTTPPPIGAPTKEGTAKKTPLETLSEELATGIFGIQTKGEQYEAFFNAIPTIWSHVYLEISNVIPAAKNCQPTLKVCGVAEFLNASLENRKILYPGREAEINATHNTNLSSQTDYILQNVRMATFPSIGTIMVNTDWLTFTQGLDLSSVVAIQEQLMALSGDLAHESFHALIPTTVPFKELPNSLLVNWTHEGTSSPTIYRRAQGFSLFPEDLNSPVLRLSEEMCATGFAQTVSEMMLGGICYLWYTEEIISGVQSGS